MKWLKRFFSNIHLYVLWALASVFLWSWIFTFATDVRPAKKVVVFIEAYAIEDPGLSIRLEEHLPEGIRQIRARPFSYAVFGTDELLSADIFIVKASSMEQYSPSLRPWDQGGEDLYYVDGVPYGVKVYDAATNTGIAMDYIQYAIPDEPAEDYYLCYGKKTLHLGERDMAALEVAEDLMRMR